VKILSSKQRAAAAAAVILLLLFLVRPGVSRLKARITNSISQAVARPTEIGSVHVRFLPQPGFDLKNVVVYEDPAFGAEPMLRAAEVTAVVRLSSLLRGRLDISRLELSEPSLNLVRREDGRWNWEALLERTARTPLAPTAKSKREARPGFPYIEASSGRINFKAGQEKKPYALLNADFAVWQDSENAWGVRLKAEPLRTDMSLSDAGLLKINGTWQRAGSLRETPLEFHMQWEGAQLGQLTKLVSGSDEGWRGEATVDAALSGTPAALQVALDTSMTDFHRYDISSSGGLRLAAHCDGTYNSTENAIQQILCSAPSNGGVITLRGDAGLRRASPVNLALNIENVPVAALMQLVRGMKKDIPADLVSAGMVQGSFTVKTNSASPHAPEFQGRGEISDLRLQSASAKVEFAAENIPFVLGEGKADGGDTAKSKEGRLEASPAGEELHLDYGPFPVALGRPAPAQGRGWITRSGYHLAIHGDGEVSHALRMAALLGLPALKASVEGTAQMDLKIAGSWAGRASGNTAEFLWPQVMGKVQLRNVRAALRGIGSPIEISSAELNLLSGEARMEKMSAMAGGAHWMGSVALPRGCGARGACAVQFKLNSDEVDLGKLAQWLNAQPGERRWYQVLSSKESTVPRFIESLRASGGVTIGRLQIRNIVASHVSASLNLDQGELRADALTADVLGGKHRGEWQADFHGPLPLYSGGGTLTDIALPQVAEAMHDSWISGAANLTYRMTASGADSATFWQSANATLQFDLRDAVFPHISLASDEGPLHVTGWQGQSRLRDGKFEIEKGKIISGTGAYEVSGTASLESVLNFRLAREPAGAGAAAYNVTGTLTEPHVEVMTGAETQARLKQ